MKKEPVLKTKRLVISCMNNDEIRELIDSCSDESLRSAYEEMQKGAIENELFRKWYAPWKICRKTDGIMVGNLCFMGEPKNDAVEVGYGLFPEYEGNGYMTEALESVLNWAFGCGEGVYFIEAETDAENTRSQKILKSLGFVPDGEGEEGPRFVKETEEGHYLSIGICLGMCIGVSLGTAFHNIAIGLAFGIGIGTLFGVMVDKKNKERIKKAREKRKTEKKQENL